MTAKSKKSTGRKGEKRHVAGVGAKEKRQYEHIKEDAEKSGR